MRFEAEINGIPVSAFYSEQNVNEIFLPLLRLWTKMQKEKGKRLLVFLAAPPGTGKSTLAAFLQFLSEKTAGITPLTVIGMDGFHRYQSYLCSHTTVRDGKEIPMVQIKGAPITFDLPRLKERIRQVAEGEACSWPIYNRMTHDPQEDALAVQGDIVLLEGNYLLLDTEGWNELRAFADYTVRLIPNIADIRNRLVERKIASGASPEQATEFVARSDLYNAKICLEHTQKADLSARMLSDGTFELLPPGFSEFSSMVTAE